MTTHPYSLETPARVLSTSLDRLIDRAEAETAVEAENRSAAHADISPSAPAATYYGDTDPRGDKWIASADGEWCVQTLTELVADVIRKRRDTARFLTDWEWQNAVEMVERALDSALATEPNIDVTYLDDFRDGSSDEPREGEQCKHCAAEWPTDTDKRELAWERWQHHQGRCAP